MTTQLSRPLTPSHRYRPCISSSCVYSTFQTSISCDISNLLLQFSHPPLEFYSTSEYSEVLQMSQSYCNNDYPAIMKEVYWYIHNKTTHNIFSNKHNVMLPNMQAQTSASGPGDYESPYYTPASQEQELYSQLRREKIKAIPKEEIELVFM